MISERKSWHHMLRWGDLLVAVSIIALAAILFLSGAGLASRAPASAQLIADGEVIRTWTAAELQAGGEETLTRHGYHYRITWQDGLIRFSEADCPDQVCVSTGWIGRPGSLSACVPGGLVLKAAGQLPGSQETDEVDVVIR